MADELPDEVRQHRLSLVSTTFRRLLATELSRDQPRRRVVEAHEAESGIER